MMRISRLLLRFINHENPRIEAASAGIFFLLTAFVFTWPLCLHFADAIPAGSEPPSVAMFQLFTVEWTGQVLDTGASYWNAPFFYPYQGVFAWCEPQLFTSLLVWLISRFAGYVAAYNIVIVFYLAAFGLAGYSAGRLFTEDRTAALFGGMWLSGGAYALQQLCSLPLAAAAIPLGCVYLSLVFAKNKSLNIFWAAALFYGLSWFTCKQLAVYLTIFLPVVLFPFFFSFSRTPCTDNRKPNTKWQVFLNLVLALIILSACIIPYSLKQYHFTRAMGFGWELGRSLGVLVFRQLLTPAYGHWLTDRILHWQWYSWDIGIVPLLAILLSLCFGIVGCRNFDPYQRKVLRGICAMIVVALLAGFQPALTLYRSLFSIFPGLSLIRIPSRSAVFAIFGVAVLSVPAFAFLRSRIRHSGVRKIITLTVFSLLCLEMGAMPIPLVFPLKETRGHQQVIDWLKENGRGLPLIELPVAKGLWSRDTEIDAAAMLRMIQHHQPILNGYESFCPAPYKQLRTALAVDLQGRGRRYLEAYGVRFIFMHAHLLKSGEREAVPLSLSATIVYDDGDHQVYALSELSRVKNESIFFPDSAVLRGIIPRAGKRYSLRLLTVPDKACLIPPSTDRFLCLTWKDAAGAVRKKKVRLAGSVIVDAGQPEFYFRLLSFPKDERAGEAVLLPPEETR